jgi:uncharacterized membrane protein YtjA (UPF0391 family)
MQGKSNLSDDESPGQHWSGGGTGHGVVPRRSANAWSDAPIYRGDDVKKLYWAALSYMVLGLAAGLYFRELTKAQDFSGFTQTAVMHTHLLALGMLVFLVLIALEKLLSLSHSRAFTVFFWVYNAGLLLTVTMMGIHGTRTVLGHPSSSGIAGAAGLGHILLTVALVFFFVALYRALFAKAGDGAQPAGRGTAEAGTVETGTAHSSAAGAGPGDSS